jgi:hypothetical protein
MRDQCIWGDNIKKGSKTSCEGTDFIFSAFDKAMMDFRSQPSEFLSAVFMMNRVFWDIVTGKLSPTFRTGVIPSSLG